MSGDEGFAFFGSIMAVVFLWGGWCFTCLTSNAFGRGQSLVALALVAPAACTALLLALLRRYASFDVRDDALYLAFYTTMGAAWIGIVARLSGLLGLSFRDDWLERRNPAATCAGIGLLLGSTCAFGGANIGDGPGWWVVVFCAVLSTSALAVAWWLCGASSGVMEKVILDRSISAGVRLGAFLVAAGIIAGRSVAGNWENTSATFVDFAALSWVLLPYALVIGFVERQHARRSAPDSLAFATLWAAGHLAFALWYVQQAGPWT
jgi:hypothetical protein